MLQEPWKGAGIRASKSAPCSPVKPLVLTRSESFHIALKVPIGDTPYVRAKRVQLVDKDPDKAIALFWAAINAGDRVDSALKDMAIVMKQQNRAEEAIEAIRSLRNRCTDQAQESLDNILLDLYKKCGRLDDQISLLRRKLHMIQQGLAFNGKRTKTARSQGRKFQVSLEQEATRLLGNLGWALMQQDNYTEAEAAYRQALRIGLDNNKMCNLGICLLKQGRVAAARDTLKRVNPAVADGPRGMDSHLKAFERAQEMLRDLEAKTAGGDGPREGWTSEALFPCASAVWQPQPCIDFAGLQDGFGDENVDVNKKPVIIGSGSKMAQPSGTSSLLGNPLNVAAPPFYSKLVKKPDEATRFHDPLSSLKRTRSGGEAMGDLLSGGGGAAAIVAGRPGERGGEADNDMWVEELLPDDDAFDEAIVAAVLAPVLEAAEGTAAMGVGRNMGKRLRVFEDITHCLSPKA